MFLRVMPKEDCNMELVAYTLTLVSNPVEFRMITNNFMRIHLFDNILLAFAISQYIYDVL